MHNYQFTVSLNGKFLFRTDLISSLNDPESVYTELFEKFPESEGYLVNVNKHQAAYESKAEFF